MGTAIFGPDVIYYDWVSGPTLIQYIQMRPGIVAIVGGLMMAWGGKQRNEGLVLRDVFLLSHYKFVTDDGRDVSDKVRVQYIEGEKFDVCLGL